MEAEAPKKAEPLAETPAKKRRNRGKRSSATLEEALTATNPVRPSAPEPDLADFRKPDPLASDVIMDATARLLAPRPRAQAPKKPKAPKQSAKAPKAEAVQPQGQSRKDNKKKAAPAAEPLHKEEPRRKKNRGSKGRRPGRPPEVVLRSNGQKDSTEQPSLMKPYYLSD